MKLKTKHIVWGGVGAIALYLVSTLPLVLVATRGLRTSSLGTEVWLRAIGETLLLPLSMYSPLSLIVVILNSLLAGAIVTGILTQGSRRPGGVAAGGLLVSILGAGCASCGSLLLGPLLAGIGGAGVLAVLPGHGVEFLLLSTLLLLYSAYSIWKRIWAPSVCQV